MPQWKQFSGMWSPAQQFQARGADEWPAPPGAPTIGTATAGNAQATVTFTAPANLGVPATITQYTVTSDPGAVTATGTASPIVVSGLTAGTAYTFTVTATNATGTGPASAASNSVTPFIAGQLWMWGSGALGQLGTNNTTTVSSPVQVGSLTNWKVLSGGRTNFFHSILDGKLYGWGRKGSPFYDGQLGDNNNIYRSSPVQIGALSNWSQTSGGFAFAVATKTDGTLWSWGFGNNGRTGQGDDIQRSSPVQIGSLTTWQKATAGVAFAVAIKTDGTVWTWGNNSNGALGQNNTISRSSPVQVGALTTWLSAVAGGYSVLAIKNDNTLWAWGSNDSGQLGDGTVAAKSSPIQIGALSNWASVDGAGSKHVIALKTDGTLWAWGDGENGQLGINERVFRSSPVQIGALTNWSKVNIGGASTTNSSAIKNDGTLWSWGANNSGQVGDGTTINRSSPVQIGALTTWIYVSHADSAMGAIKTA